MESILRTTTRPVKSNIGNSHRGRSNLSNSRRSYHKINRDTPNVGKFNGYLPHHVKVIGVDEENNAYVSVLSKNLRSSKYSTKNNLGQLKTRQSKLTKNNWYKGENQDKSAIPLGKIKAND